MGTDHQPVGFISSQQTENSEQQQRAISLGKALVRELGLEPGVDTLSRWITHYISEQMAIAENATGEEKAKAEKRCFDSIMQLWQHRNALPNERSPFKDFIPIFETLQRLNPENQESFYIGWDHHQNNPDEESPSDSEEAKSWLRMALSIDKTARVLLEAVLQQAALKVTNSKARAWLKRAPDPSQDFDVRVIVKLVGDLDSSDESGDQTDLDNDQEPVDVISNEQPRRTVETRLQYLEEFLELASLYRDGLRNELDKATS